jgi:tRNA threonylcarbamoyladenosine biosynthesis protein TsaB
LKILSLDTSEVRGGVALLRDGEPVAVQRHESSVDYSEWLLPSVDAVLHESGVRMEEIDVVAASTGPGSFTGLRVGLTTVKAWAEVYGKPVVGVSRLEALARSGREGGEFVAACYDAQRGQIFAALYRNVSGQLARWQDEMVIPAEEFLKLVDEEAGSKSVSWFSLDAELITSREGWKARSERGDTMSRVEPELATAIGRLAEERARVGMFSDALTLDANYVRRSDAEIFWKGR